MIQAKGFDININNTNVIAENKEIIEALEKSGEAAKDQKKAALNNILIDAEDWEVVDKRKKLNKNKAKEKEKANFISNKVIEIKEEPKLVVRKQEDSVDIVEKLKMNNPYFQNKDANNKPLNSIESLLNNNKFEVVVKKKKKKDDGKTKPPGNLLLI